MNNIFLIEDHDEALEVWRKSKLRGLDLAHIDAHVDFGFYQAKPIEQIIEQARSVKELKRSLEVSLNFRHYEKDFDKQTNIGNYVYPAMCEGIVRDFYWVVPGGVKEFKESGKLIKNIVSRLVSQTRNSEYQVTGNRFNEGIIQLELLGRKFVVCVLERLPKLNQKVLLDIDTDFLVVDSLLNANNTDKIGKRKRWIRPKDLTKTLKDKIKSPQITTIAYSVNGGYTPIIYKHFGDEIAYNFSPSDFGKRYANNFKAAQNFDLFRSTDKKKYYESAVKLNPTYRVTDNNYGPLYLSLRKFFKAGKEFLKIARVDPKNPYPLVGLGNIALEKKEFNKAKRYFSRALKQLAVTRDFSIFPEVGAQNFAPLQKISLSNNDAKPRILQEYQQKEDLAAALFGLAQVNFRLKNFPEAKKLFLRYQSLQHLHPQSRYFLGRIYEKEANFEEAAACYQDAMRLGLSNIDIISRLLRISYYTKAKDDIIEFVSTKYREFKKGFIRIKKLTLRRNKANRLRRIEQKMAAIEKRFNRVTI